MSGDNQKTHRHVLNERLDNRVDDMMTQGLVNELLTFHKRLTSRSLNECSDGDYTHGILQSIGFKEFHDFLMLSDEEHLTVADPVRSEKLIEEGVEKLKLVTKRYARRQIKWIRNRFLRKPERQMPRVYRVDSTNVTAWEDDVMAPATDVVAAHMSGSLPSTVDPVPVEKDAPHYEQTTFFCDVCQRVLMGELQWNIHLQSKRHKKVKQSARKKSLGETNS